MVNKAGKTGPSPAETGVFGSGEEHERHRRLILFAITMILIIIAAAVIIINTVNPKKHNIGTCMGIFLPQQKYNCMYALANSTNNYTICSYIQPSQSAYKCIGSIAERNNNATACSIINSSSYEYDNCIENVSLSTLDASYCGSLDNYNASVCAYDVAKAGSFSSIGYCSSIPANSQKMLCTYMYYYGMSLKSKDGSYCALLPNVTNDTLLYSIFTENYTGIKLLNSSYLSFSEFNITPRDYCFYSLALYSRNSSVCSLASSGVSGLCADYFKVMNSSSALTGNVTTLCKNAPSYAQGLCNYTIYTEEAVAQKNISSCNAISNASYRSECITELAYRYNDSSFCNYLSFNSTVEQLCVESATASISSK